MSAMIVWNPKKKRILQRNIRTALYHGLLVVFGFLMIYPLLWMFASSFKETSDIWTNMTSLIPKKFTLEHYTNGWRGFGGITFTTYYRNTIFLTVVSTRFLTAFWLTFLAPMDLHCSSRMGKLRNILVND